MKQGKENKTMRQNNNYYYYETGKEQDTGRK